MVKNLENIPKHGIILLSIILRWVMYFKDKLRSKLKNKNGFTLVELLVCLVILVILSSMAIPSMLGYIDKSKEMICKINRLTILRGWEYMKLFESISLDDYLISGDAYITNAVCPTKGEYSIVDGYAIKCSHHGELVTNGNTGPSSSATPTPTLPPNPTPTPGGGGSNPTPTPMVTPTPNPGGSGSITIPDYDGGDHTITVSGIWEDIKSQFISNNPYYQGGSIAPGTVLSDSTGMYLFYSNDAQYTISSLSGQDTTLAQLTSANSDRIIQITDSSTVFTENNYSDLGNNNHR